MEDLNEWKEQAPKIFRTVRKHVQNVYGRRRAGLNLGLAEMGMFHGGFIGGMHFAPGTDIIMNKTPLKIILDEHPMEIAWAYTYHILLHEYIHSLGVLDEEYCRILTLKVSEENFKDSDHPAVVLARKGIGAYFTNVSIRYAPPDYQPGGIPVEYLKHFDTESLSYYS